MTTTYSGKEGGAKVAIDSFEFDVAISFRNTDLQLALQIADLLKPNLRVFVYSRQQETVAATDGLESFRDVFRHRARLSVVLLRKGWGETPWTGVEEVAIKDRCLKTKYKSLVVVHLDDSASPDWIPDTQIHFDLNTYSMEELVGIIKMRAVEVGADLKIPSVADRAEAVERRRQFEAETRNQLQNSAAPFQKALADLKKEISEQVTQIAARTGWTFECGEPAALIGGFILSTEGRSIQLAPQSLYANTAREAYLAVREYSIGIPVQQPGKMYGLPGGRLEPAKSWKVELHRDPALDWCWRLNKKIRTVAGTAEAIVELLVESVAKHSR